MTLVRRFFVTVSTVLLASCGVAVAGGNAGDFGLGVTTIVPGPSFWGWDGSYEIKPGFPTFAFRYWSSETFTIDPSFGVVFASGDGESDARLIPGLGFAYHGRPKANMRPYVGLGFGFDIALYDETFVDIIISPTLGAEYFLSDDFSVGGEYRLSIVFTDEDMSPSPLSDEATYIISFQALSVHFYF